MLLSLGKKIGFIILSFCAYIAGGQTSVNVLGQNITGSTNIVTTAVPFLMIAPDARANGMGEDGVASEPDANSTFWNPAKLAFVKDSFGFSESFLPWLRQLVPGINMNYLSGYFKLPHNQTLGFSWRLITYDSIQFTNNNGVAVGNFNPYEFALDVSYARQLSDNVSVGLTGRYIYSDITGASVVQGEYTHPGQSVAVDLSAYHKSNEINIFGKSTILSEGVCISNIGAKITYSNSGVANFLPTNLRLGGDWAIDINDKNKLCLLADANKLLVPTPPVYELNTVNGGVSFKNGQPVILAGMNPNVSVPQGMLQSFYDAPGGALEEWHEITWSTGVEYSYNERIFARVGYFYENPTKGGREFYTTGAGFKLAFVKIDAAYLIPITQQNPLQNTFCISASFNFQYKKQTNTSTKVS